MSKIINLNVGKLFSAHFSSIKAKGNFAKVLGGNIQTFLETALKDDKTKKPIVDKDGKPAFPSPCAIKLSFAMHESGYPLNKQAKAGNYRDRLGRPYLLNVQEFVEYLIEQGYEPTVFPNVYWKDIAWLKKQMLGRFAIVAYGWAHIDLWENDKQNSMPDVTERFKDCWKRGLFVWDLVNPQLRGTTQYEF